MSLPRFERRDVSKSSIKITRAGDGLSAALDIEPVALHHDDRVFFVLEGEVVDVQHPKQDGKVVRKHVIETKNITQVQRDEVEKFILAANDRIDREREAGKGAVRLEDQEP